MKDAHTDKASKTMTDTDWKRLRAKSDAEVHRALVADPEVAPTDEAFWRDAKLVMPYRNVPDTIRFDFDLLE